jgi:mono/diheme cytochrome c family protein
MKSTADPLDPVQEYELRRSRRRRLIIGVVLFLLFLAVYWGVLAEVPEDHTGIEDHFKYGSIGSEPAAGVPYWIWQVLPEMFPEHLPDPDRFRALPPAERTALAGYAQFGFVVEDDKERPIGFSKRRVLVDRVGLNCAVCHTGTVRVAPGMDPAKIYGAEPAYAAGGKDRVIVLGMPAHTMDLHRYFKFLIDCCLDGKFTVTNVMGYIDARTSLGPLERRFYEAAVPRVREAQAVTAQKLGPLLKNPPAGPGRVDTFNPYKVLVFGFPWEPSIGTADLPSLWNQRPREGLWLHWDGNNNSVFERNISASLGAGATPVSLDLPRMMRVADWIGSPDPRKRPATADESRQARANPVPAVGELPVPKYPFAIDESLAARGAKVFQANCHRCHGWDGERLGQVEAIGEIGTDPHRLASYTTALAYNQNTLGAGQWWRFSHFRKTNGYANMPLDGLWARAPYLHNGSVPTLADLLRKPADRPKEFFRGDDRYDPEKAGFRHDSDTSADGRTLFRFEVRQEGNGNGGHLYGTDLPEEDRRALLEYLKRL